MVKALPNRFNPDLLARDGTSFQVSIPQAQLTRLAELLLSSEHDVHCTARFSRRKDNIAISGRIKTVFAMECQRCLKPMEMEIDEPYELVFVDDEERAESLPKQLDPVILDEHGNIHVVDLFEDEIILHVPEIPRHSEDACQVNKTEFGDLPDNIDEGKPNPFDALKGLNLH